MSALSAYRALPRLAGADLLILAFLARLPVAMAPLGVLLLVVHTTGSYAAAGLTAAALGIGAAVGGPLVGVLSDRYGQRRTGLVTALVDAAAYLGLTAAVLAGATAPGIVLAALAGLANPQVGPLVRARWAGLLAGGQHDRVLPTALAYEGAVDEASFVFGPALVGLLALGGAAHLPLLAAAVLMVCAAIPFALHRSAPGSTRRRLSGRARPARLPAVLPALVAGMLFLGVVYGSTQTGVIAFTEATGRSGTAGLIYAVMGTGSALAGVATAWLPDRLRLTTRYPLAAAVLALGALPLLVAGELPAVLVAMAVLGVTAAPYLITSYALAQLRTPAGRTGTAMTLLSSGLVGGVAIGAAVAGRLVDSFGYRGAWLVPAMAAILATGLAVRATAGRRDRVPADSPRAARRPQLGRRPAPEQRAEQRTNEQVRSSRR